MATYIFHSITSYIPCSPPSFTVFLHHVPSLLLLSLLCILYHFLPDLQFSDRLFQPWLTANEFEAAK